MPPTPFLGASPRGCIYIHVCISMYPPGQPEDQGRSPQILGQGERIIFQTKALLWFSTLTQEERRGKSGSYRHSAKKLWQHSNCFSISERVKLVTAKDTIGPFARLAWSLQENRFAAVMRRDEAGSLCGVVNYAEEMETLRSADFKGDGAFSPVEVVVYVDWFSRCWRHLKGGATRSKTQHLNTWVDLAPKHVAKVVQGVWVSQKGKEMNAERYLNERVWDWRGPATSSSKSSSFLFGWLQCLFLHGSLRSFQMPAKGVESVIRV